MMENLVHLYLLYDAVRFSEGAKAVMRNLMTMTSTEIAIWALVQCIANV